MAGTDGFEERTHFCGEAILKLEGGKGMPAIERAVSVKTERPACSPVEHRARVEAGPVSVERDTPYAVRAMVPCEGSIAV